MSARKLMTSRDVYDVSVNVVVNKTTCRERVAPGILFVTWIVLVIVHLGTRPPMTEVKVAVTSSVVNVVLVNGARGGIVVVR